VIDWPVLATVAVTGLCLLVGLSLAISALVVWPALNMVDELTGLLEVDE